MTNEQHMEIAQDLLRENQKISLSISAIEGGNFLFAFLCDKTKQRLAWVVASTLDEGFGWIVSELQDNLYYGRIRPLAEIDKIP